MVATLMHKRKPIYLLAGGKRNNQDSLNRLLQIVFKDNVMPSPSITYIGTANGDDKFFFECIANRFKKAGGIRVTHAIITSDKADLGKSKDILRSADIIFVSGGDVEEGMRVLEEKNMTNFLSRLYETGKPFFGLSAGSIMLSKKWVRWSDPNDDSTANLFPCLGFAPIVCDTHGEQDNWEELQVTLKLVEDEMIGYGIVSGAAIKVYSNGIVEALGLPIHRYLHNENQVIRIADIFPYGTKTS
jgi:peptidase E